MEKKKSRKLTLNRETLRNLSAQELSLAHGGGKMTEICKSVNTGGGGGDGYAPGEVNAMANAPCPTKGE